MLFRTAVAIARHEVIRRGVDARHRWFRWLLRSSVAIPPVRGPDSAHAASHCRAAGHGRRSRHHARTVGSPQCTSCAAWGNATVGAVGEHAVGEEAAFDGLYNIALQPAIGAPPAGRARPSPRRCIRVGAHVTPAVDFHRALARAARG